MQQPAPYTRRVNYYETDKMGFVHHSNYIRYMEEARMDYMKKIGVDYRGLEEQGVIIPVTAVSCRYLRSCYFDDALTIAVHTASYTGARVAFRYEIYRGDTLCAAGESGHCFLGEGGVPVNLRKRFPAYSRILTDLIEE